MLSKQLTANFKKAWNLFVSEEDSAWFQEKKPKIFESFIQLRPNILMLKYSSAFSDKYRQ